MTGTLKHFWRTRTARWSVMAGIVLVACIALVLMFLLAQSTNSAVYERNYQHLLVANAVAASLLFLVLLWLAWRMWRGLRRGKFGSRLLLKLALVFALVASVPGALLYLVAYQFVSRSIESWFDVKVERALSAGLSLGQSVLDTLTTDAANKAQAAAHVLGAQPAFDMGVALDRLRSQQNADRLVLWSASGQQIAASSQQSFATATQPPSAEVLAQLQEQPAVAYVEGLEEAGEQAGEQTAATAESAAQTAPAATEPGAAANAAGPVTIVAYTLVRPAQFGLHSETWVLQLTQPVPADLLHNAVLVQEANREYQERALTRIGMQRMFISTLTLTLFLAVFGAVLLAALISAQLARPLLLLAAGVRQVAEGDLRPKHIHDARDELGGLTRAFAQMTQQLADARQAASSSLAELDASRSELQTILDNLSSGVLVLHPDGTILSANPGASRILRIAQEELPGHTLGALDGLQQLGETVQQQFMALAGSQPLADAEADTLIESDEALPERMDALSDAGGDAGGDACAAFAATDAANSAWPAAGPGNYWQHSMELNPPAHEGLQQEAVTLVLRGALLPESEVPGARLLVFEDISAEVSAQRAQAWGEVARRLAHEIKNPLTPIRLSAERLEMKLMAHLPLKEQEVLARSVHTIVEQVDAMKRLVDEFRDYARLPAAQLQPLDVNALINDVLQLYGAENAQVPVQSELDPDCQPVLADAQQLRQVIHNLLQNAQDAQQQADRPNDRQTAEPVLIQTQWRPAAQRVRLTVSDAGPGFPEHILQRAFEPYVTTKARGTGLGLAVVKKIADEHNARIAISNRVQDGVVLGAQVSLLIPAAEPKQAERPQLDLWSHPAG
ncbi:MAG: ATP-binding protein [Brachymonas sp.]|nr:ATP-binding protein [Brachymonas sp.]